MIIAKKLNIYRNILHYKFVHKETSTNLKRIEDELINYFIKHNFILYNKEINNKQFKVLENKKQNIEIILNYINHITITNIDFFENEFYQSYLNIIEIEEKIKEKFDIAFSEKFGYLTPYPTYLPHAIDLELIISLFFCNKYNQQDKIIKNIISSGFEVKKEFIPFDYIITIKLLPNQKQNIKDFLTKSSALAKSIEKEEENNFKIYISKNKIIFKDMIEKLKGYALNSNILDYKESIEILTYMLYASKDRYILTTPDVIKKAIFLTKNSNLIKDMKVNSKITKGAIKNGA